MGSKDKLKMYVVKFEFQPISYNILYIKYT